jgi:tetratricopeptide (TPR) repeat protein/tRNA A-37 threonylcarbamoyl transferase component Bud32
MGDSSAPPGPGALPQRTRFVILRPHARGGLGEVFIARDEELEREVALKEIQERHADQVESRERFLKEARVTGALEHPGIVPVYGLGTYADGRPFYAMRFIRGDSLKDSIVAFHHPAQKTQSPSERSLALRQLLGRFIAVCNAIAYAHSQGVLHRDLKPANIMLGKFGETLVVDWGLAKILGETVIEATASALVRSGDVALTQEGRVLGTPAYMSPEQAAGNVDLGPCSDVYSLGATLYCLLTGQPPFPETKADAVLDRVRHGDFPPPRRINPSVPAALEAVCLKAMALSPQDRYGSPRELAEEIDRWLADEPVKAYPEPWVARMGRWLRRHQAHASAAVAAVLVGLVVGGGGWWWYRHEKDLRAARAADEIRQVLTRASRLQGEARATRNARSWADALAAVQRAAEIAAGADVGAELRRQVAELEVEVAQEAREVERDQKMLAQLEEVRIRRAEVRDAGSGREGFDFSSVWPGYAQAFRTFGLDVETMKPELAGAEIKKRAIQSTLVTALDEWAWFIHQASPNAPNWQRLVAAARVADPDPWRNRLRDALTQKDVQALKDLAANANCAELPAVTLELLGHALGQAGAQPEATALLRRAQRQYPGDFWINHYLAYFLATCHPPELDDAIRFYSVAIALRSDNPGVYVNYGQALLQKGLLEEASFAFEKAVALKGDYVMARLALGRVQVQRGEWARAIASLREVCRRQPGNADAHAYLAAALLNTGELDEALVSADRAIAREPRLFLAHKVRGVALAKKKRFEDAIVAYQQLIALKPDDAETHDNLGKAWKVQKQWDRAIASFREAIHLRPDNAETHFELGILLSDRKQDHDAAAEEFRDALRLKPDYAEALCNLAHVLGKKGQFVEALEAARRGHELGSKKPGWRGSSPQWVSEFERLAELDRKLAAVLRGEVALASAEERIEMARLCARKQHYATAAQFCEEAFAARPELTENLRANNRFNAACMAVQAAAGLGADAATLDREKRGPWRQKALAWLRADLAQMREELKRQPAQGRKWVEVALPNWQAADLLATVRDEAPLARLPEAEQKAWQLLWADVAALLKDARGG